MQIVIDIPEERYEEYKRIGDSRDILFEAIRKGIILPEHHGDLKDVNSFEASCFMGSSMYYTQSDIEYAETIIPATERSNNADCN